MDGCGNAYRAWPGGPVATEVREVKDTWLIFSTARRQWVKRCLRRKPTQCGVLWTHKRPGGVGAKVSLVDRSSVRRGASDRQVGWRWELFEGCKYYARLFVQGLATLPTTGVFRSRIQRKEQADLAEVAEVAEWGTTFGPGCWPRPVQGWVLAADLRWHQCRQPRTTPLGSRCMEAAMMWRQRKGDSGGGGRSGIPPAASTAHIGWQTGAPVMVVDQKITVRWLAKASISSMTPEIDMPAASTLPPTPPKYSAGPAGLKKGSQNEQKTDGVTTPRPRALSRVVGSIEIPIRRRNATIVGEHESLTSEEPPVGWDRRDRRSARPALSFKFRICCVKIGRLIKPPVAVSSPRRDQLEARAFGLTPAYCEPWGGRAASAS